MASLDLSPLFPLLAAVAIAIMAWQIGRIMREQ